MTIHTNTYKCIHIHKYVHILTRAAPLCLFNAQKVPWRHGFETRKRQNWRICPIVCGCKNRPMEQDPRVFLARKLDFQRVILKNFGALRAPVRKREDLLLGREAIFGYPKRNGFPSEPIAIQGCRNLWPPPPPKTDHCMVRGLRP